MVNAPKLKALVISLAAATLLAATPALADGGDRNNRNSGHGHYQAHHNGQGHKYGHNKRGHKRQQAYKRGYRQGYNNGHYRGGYGYRTPYYGYKRPYYRSSGGSSFSFTYSVAPRPVYVAPAPRVVYSQPAPTTTVITTPVNYAPAPVTAGASSCLMTREYQTEIVVGNQVVPGYGNACLQPDGSWLRLPARPVPQY